jgi:hypothetical protein
MRLKRLVAIAAAVTAAIAFWWWYDTAGSHKESPSAASGMSGGISSPAMLGSADDKLSDAQLQARVEEVRAEMKKTGRTITEENIQQAMQTVRYVEFMERANDLMQGKLRKLSAEEATKLNAEVVHMLDGNYLLFPEALSLKKRLLENQYGSDVPPAAMAELDKWAKETADRIRQQDDPNKDPRYTAWQKAQQDVYDRAKAMQQFPAGVTREAYISAELEKAHRMAYKY